MLRKALVGLGIAMGLGLAAMPSVAQMAACVRVSDPDGWVNVRDRSSGAVVGRFYNSTRFYVEEQTSDGYAIVAESPSLIVHRSRLVNLGNTTHCVFRYIVRDPDGWTNVRATPGGSVVGTVDSGQRVFSIIGRGEPGEWRKVVTPDGLLGYIHSSRLRDVN
jgi:hypothetical protein